MIFTVLWKFSAEGELAQLWIGAEDRQAISVAADRIDEARRVDPMSQGESRSDQTRILFEPPLVVQFDVHEDDRMVYVLSVRLVEDAGGD